MKYVIATLLFLAICIAVGWGITRLVSEKAGHRIVNKAVMTAAVSLVLIAACCFAYLEIYYHADKDVEDYLESGDSVAVSQSGSAYFFDGPGDERAIIFFPGAKVEETAYAPLMFRAAEQGIDCFLIKAPFRMAMLAMKAPDELIRENDYESWYMMGHSLGGIAAVGYCCDHPDEIDGVVLLASYPASELPDSVRLLSIYGSNDGCLDMQAYRAAKEKWPKKSREAVIKGGNHAGFGYYGPQKGDGKADITPYEQQSIVIDEIKSAGLLSCERN